MASATQISKRFLRSLSGRARVTNTSNVLASLLLLALLSLIASTAVAENKVRLQCKPETFSVVPGEPIQLQLTIKSDSAVPFRLIVPKIPMLKLRAIEKLPVRRTREGTIVYQRVLVWQGLEPGTVKLKDILVKIKDQKLLFPEITITVRDPNP